jgi:hypothetical protein
MKECSAKYKTAKESGTLAGMKWNGFRKAQCGAQAAAEATTSAAPPPPAARPAKTTAASAPGQRATRYFPLPFRPSGLAGGRLAPGPAGRIQAPGFENFSCRVVLQGAAAADRDLAKKAYRDGLGREMARNPRRTADPVLDLHPATPGRSDRASRRASIHALTQAYSPKITI